MNGKWQPARLSRKQKEERRLEGQRLLAEGDHTTTQIAQYLGVSDATIRKWRIKLRVHGEQALKASTGSGRPKQLTTEQEQQLGKLIDAGAKSYGFPNEQWTSPRVREVIGQQYGVWYHVDHVYKLLIKLGFSLQKPDKRALERNEEAIQTWVRTCGVELGEKDQAGNDRGLSRRKRVQSQDHHDQNLGT